MWDPVALDTWREALSGMVLTEVPHELLALWLYTPDHAAVLIGPRELEADHLEVPTPDPRIDPKELWVLEQRIRDAGYGSALAIAISHGERDVGLALLAGLAPDTYRDAEVNFVTSILAGLAPTMARVGQQWSHDGDLEEEVDETRYRRREEPGRALHELRDFLADLADTIALSESPASLVTGLSHALAAVLPHDDLEIVVPHPPRRGFYRLAGHEEGPLFVRNELWTTTDAFDPAALLDDHGAFVVSDAAVPDSAPAWPGNAEPRIRAVVGVRLGSHRDPVGYLVVGSQGPGMYSAEDCETLHRLAPLIAPRVEQFSLSGQVQTLRSHLGVLRQVPTHLGRLAELLATTAHVGVATKSFAQEAASVVPFQRLEFALRMGRETDVVVLTPGETRSLDALQPVDVSGTELGRVLRSEITHALATATQTGPAAADQSPSAALVVPLRVAGRVVGAMTLVATGTDSFAPTDLVLAQQLADLAAPHLELVRRAALPVGPGARRAGP